MQHIPGKWELVRRQQLHRHPLALNAPYPELRWDQTDAHSRSTMEAGLWTGKGYSAPWMYHRVAGQYTLLEKHLVSDFSPCQRRPGSRVLQDSTNWHDAPHPPRWGPPRQEGPWFAGKEVRRAAASPKPCSQRSPTLDGLNPACRRELCWGAAPAPERGKGHVGVPSESRGDPPARSPPSYEAHMLLRLRAGQGPRKENWPRPPPYVAPPSYEAAHRTVQPQPRARKATGAGSPPSPPDAPPKRACEGGARAPSAARKRGHCPAKVPGGWSYLPAGARTWAGRRRPSERAAASWPRSPPTRSHTLPRVTKRPPASCPVPVPQGALPAGWGFGHTAGRLGPAGTGSRDLLPRWKEPGGRLRERGGSSQAAGPKPPPRPSGGLMVIDATCVVIQTHYIPPARPERVRYVGQPGATRSPAPGAPASPAAGSLEERASRILGLPLSELAFTQPSGAASPRRGAEGGGPAGAGAAAGLARPEWAPSPPQGSPRQPRPSPAPEGPPAQPPQPRPNCPEGGRAAGAGPGGDGCAPEEAEPPCGPRSRSYVRDLREAMSRIRRHTAPDSDSDEEPEKAGGGRAGERLPWKGRLNDAALSYSSSSLESSGGSAATVVPGNATSTTTSTARGQQPC